MKTHEFKFKDLTIRAVEIEGEPWFVAKDVCEALGLRHVSNSLKPLDASEISRCNRITLGAKRGGADMPIVSESGLYKLIMRSDKPEAKAFQDWVTREVLPAIRKTGGYLLNEEARDTAHADDRAAMPLPEGFARLRAHIEVTHQRWPRASTE